MKILLFTLVFLIHIQASTDEILSLAWKISAERANGLGTGFFISPNTFVTNFHVLAPLLQQAQLRDIHIIQNGNTQVISVAKIVSMSALHDLAIVRTSQSVDSYLRTTNQPLRSQQPLVIAGYPKGRLRVLRQVEPITVSSDQSMSFPVNQPSSLKGSSGAPIMNLRSEVVGIVSEMYYNIVNLPITIEQLNHVMRGNQSINRCHNCRPQDWINQALQQLTRLANRDKTAQYKLGLYYYEGGVVKQSTSQSKKWLRKASKKGHLHAQTKLSEILFEEHKMHSTEGLRWLRQAAEGGVALANFLLSQFILQFREHSFAGEDWINRYNELVERTRTQGLYISYDVPLMDSGSSICQKSFSSP